MITDREITFRQSSFETNVCLIELVDQSSPGKMCKTDKNFKGRTKSELLRFAGAMVLRVGCFCTCCRLVFAGTLKALRVQLLRQTLLASRTHDMYIQ